ncbi:MAG: hypothetical protein JWP36_2114, partial [Paucimonas sp.]|nr:hypothetical protein [Paucimonas sp.]
MNNNTSIRQGNQVATNPGSFRAGASAPAATEEQKLQKLHKVFATADEASRIDALLHLWGGQARTAGIAEAANAFHSLGVKP